MTDPHTPHTDAAHIVLHAWIGAYLAGEGTAENAQRGTLSARLADHSSKLRESAAQLAAALEKMRIANAKLALRMAEHKAFFAKYQTPE